MEQIGSMRKQKLVRYLVQTDHQYIIIIVVVVVGFFVVVSLLFSATNIYLHVTYFY